MKPYLETRVEAETKHIFVGRKYELNAIHKLLSRSLGVPILVLGQRGIGKTLCVNVVETPSL